jgi:hypothetical protein
MERRLCTDWVDALDVARSRSRCICVCVCDVLCEEDDNDGIAWRECVLAMERKEDMDAVFGMLDVRGWAGAADVDADADAENDGYLDKSAGSMAAPSTSASHPPLPPSTHALMQAAVASLTRQTRRPFSPAAAPAYLTCASSAAPPRDGPAQTQDDPHPREEAPVPPREYVASVASQA